MQEKIAQEKAQETLMVEAIIKSQEKERKRIGEGLHDDIAPILASTLMNLESQIRINKGRNITHTENAIEFIENVMDKIRDTSHLLHPATLENYGFIRGLEDFCLIMNSSQGCKIEIHTILKQVSLDTFKQLLLFRMNQELILNALKHGNAKNFKIYIYENLEELNLRVLHDGITFLRQDYLKGLQNTESLGLKNIQHSLKYLSGNINFSNNDTKSEQCIHLHFPLDKPN